MTSQRTIDITLRGIPDAQLKRTLNRLDTIERSALKIKLDVNPAALRAVGDLGASIQDANTRIMQASSHVDTLGSDARRAEGDIRNLTAELRRVGSTASGARRAGGAIDDLGSDARRAESDVSSLVTSLKGIGPAVGGAAIAGGLVIAADRLGEEAAQILAISRQTGLTVEAVQAIQARAAVIGQDLDVGDFTEVSNRLGEIRQEALRGEEATIGINQALKDLGFDPREITAQQIPEILQALGEVEDQARRAFLGDEIFSSAFERIAPSLNLPDDLQRQLDNTARSSEALLESMERNRIKTQQVTAQFKAAASVGLGSFVQAASPAVDILSKLSLGLADIVESNPYLITALGALGAATLVLAKRQVILNAALAAGAILRGGPAGLIQVGTAIATAAAIGGVGYYAISRGSQIQDEQGDSLGIQSRQDRQNEAIASGAREGVSDGAKDIATELANQQDNTLRAITPAVDCLNERVNNNDETTRFNQTQLNNLLAQAANASNVNVVDIPTQVAVAQRQEQRVQTVNATIQEAIDSIANRQPIPPGVADALNVNQDILDTSVGSRYEQRRLASLRYNIDQREGLPGFIDPNPFVFAEPDDSLVGRLPVIEQTIVFNGPVSSEDAVERISEEVYNATMEAEQDAAEALSR